MDAMPDEDHSNPCKIAVLIPCYNEAVTIGQVVKDFRTALPSATVYVYDNNSTDSTSQVAREAGAEVRLETLQGKGNVIRRMFADIEADIYVMVDGDDTYDAACAPAMIEHLIEHRLDMVNGARVTDIEAAYRPGHRWGNRLLTGFVATIFGNRIHDMLSGYRVFSRRFVKSFPALSSGFETETELTVHALELRMQVAEMETRYKDRPEGSISKLSTVKDGVRILKTILHLIKEERPLQFFTMIAASLALISVLLAIPILLTYLETGLVPRFPTAILCSALMLLAFLSFYAGLILNTVTTARREFKRLVYLRIPLMRAGPDASPPGA
jgi:glycosyltransferase involved in cell wall biosynthesis